MNRPPGRRARRTAANTAGTSVLQWLSTPKGWVGDRAYDCGRLTKSRSVVLAEKEDLSRGIRRTLDAFTSAAELNRERARRWALLSAVQAAYGGCRRGFRPGRHGAERARLIALVDEPARILTACDFTNTAAHRRGGPGTSSMTGHAGHEGQLGERVSRRGASKTGSRSSSIRAASCRARA